LKFIRLFCFRFTLFFVPLFVITLPFRLSVIPTTGKWLSPFFEAWAKWTGDYLFQLSYPYVSAIISDSTGMYLHVFNLAVVSLLLAVGWTVIQKSQPHFAQWKYWLHSFAAYYLALLLLRYGFDKVFKHQFYLPEPNTLFTSLGQLSPDILYWSTIGSSWSYSVFAGVIELIPGVLLLFQRTRQLGAMIALMVMANVVMINFAFDVSVKVLSLFLLGLCLMIAWPGMEKIFRLLVRQQQVDGQQWRLTFASRKRALLYAVSKSFVIGLIAVEVLFVFVQAGNYNDDVAARPFLHGAYQVEVQHLADSTSWISEEANKKMKRIFIHRAGYFIVQQADDTFIDYPLQYDYANEQLILHPNGKPVIRCNYAYSEEDSLLHLRGALGSGMGEVQARKLNLDKLPLRAQEFHWTMDAPR